MSDYSNVHAARPTTYAGVNFRSRLEARWAVMFEQLGMRWEYEPIDLRGWTPDFRLTVNAPVWMSFEEDDELGIPPTQVDRTDVNIFAEVKPVYATHEGELMRHACYDKAIEHCGEVWVLCLGAEPFRWGLGHLLQPPASRPNGVHWDDIHIAINRITVSDPDTTGHRPDYEGLWRQAGNEVQWKGDSSHGVGERRVIHPWERRVIFR